MKLLMIIFSKTKVWNLLIFDLTSWKAKAPKGNLVATVTENPLGPLIILAIRYLLSDSFPSTHQRSPHVAILPANASLLLEGPAEAPQTAPSSPQSSACLWTALRRLLALAQLSSSLPASENQHPTQHLHCNIGHRPEKPKYCSRSRYQPGTSLHYFVLTGCSQPGGCNLAGDSPHSIEQVCFLISSTQRDIYATEASASPEAWCMLPGWPGMMC